MPNVAENSTAPHANQKEIALLCQDFYPETISTGLFMTELAVKLSHSGYQLRVYCAKPVYKDETQTEQVPSYLEYEGVKIFRVPTIGNHQYNLLTRGLFSFSYLISTVWMIFRHRRKLAGVIVTTSPPFIGLVALLLKFLCRIPFISIVYDVYPDVVVKLNILPANSLLVRLWEKVSELILHHASRIVIIGRDMVAPVQTKLKKPQSIAFDFIPNWANESRIEPVSQATNSFVKQHNLQNKFVVQYSGRMGRVHNLNPLLEAAHLLQDYPIQFQFIGDGAQRQALQAQAEEMALKNVQFLPYQPLSKLSEVLSAADLGVVSLASSFTGLSVPSKSYGIMASGTPILALLEPSSEIGQMIQEVDCGIVLPNPSGTELAGVIRELKAQREQLTMMGQRGRAAFEQSYTLNKSATLYQSVLDQAFNGL